MYKARKAKEQFLRYTLIKINNYSSSYCGKYTTCRDCGIRDFNKQNNNIVIKVDNKVVKGIPITKVNGSKIFDFKFKSIT
jgi:hypothetical protein